MPVCGGRVMNAIGFTAPLGAKTPPPARSLAIGFTVPLASPAPEVLFAHDCPLCLGGGAKPLRGFGFMAPATRLGLTACSCCAGTGTVFGREIGFKG